jgi:hypothetical protein
MKMKRPQSSGALTPLPPSAASITRCSGVISSPSTSATRGRIQTVAGPGSRKRPLAKTISIAVCQPVVSPVGKNSSASASSWPGGGSSCSQSASTSDAASRHPRARASSPPAPSSLASTISTLRPGRTTWAVRVMGSIGSGFRTSTVTRPTRMPSLGSHSSIARASSADGGPACCDPGSHGPRVSSVGAARSPSTA